MSVFNLAQKRSFPPLCISLFPEQSTLAAARLLNSRSLSSTLEERLRLPLPLESAQLNENNNFEFSRIFETIVFRSEQKQGLSARWRCASSMAVEL
jgi:hypothetical protein